MADYRDELAAAQERIAALESELAARETPPRAEPIVEKPRRPRPSRLMRAALRARLGEPLPPAWTVWAAFILGVANCGWLGSIEPSLVGTWGSMISITVLFGYAGFAGLKRYASRPPEGD